MRDRGCMRGKIWRGVRKKNRVELDECDRDREGGIGSNEQK